MAKRSGIDFWLEILVTGDGPYYWSRLGPARSDAGSQITEQVDTTNKSDAPWRQLLTCGVRSATLSSQGVVAFPEPALTQLINAKMADQHVEARLISDGYRVWLQGSYSIEAFERSGEHDGAEEYSLTLASNGQLLNGFTSPYDLGVPSTLDVMVGLRRVIPSHTGPCMRVRRTSDFAETDINFDGSGWIDEAALLAFSQGTQCYVAKWYDQSSNVPRRNFIQPSATKQFWVTDAVGVLLRDSLGIPHVYAEGPLNITSMYTEANVSNLSRKIQAAVVAPENYVVGGSFNNYLTGSTTASHYYSWRAGMRGAGILRKITTNPSAGTSPHAETANDAFPAWGTTIAACYIPSSVVPFYHHINGVIPAHITAGSGANWASNLKMGLGREQFDTSQNFRGRIYEYWLWAGEAVQSWADDISLNLARAFGVA